MNEIEKVVETLGEKVETLLNEVADIKGDIRSVKENQNRTARTVRDIEEEYPLLPPEAEDLANAVKRKGVEVLGGKKSGAYGNANLRKRVYRDIYCEIKRQYGLITENGTYMSYKKLKRKHFNSALDVVGLYEPPVSLLNEITDENDLEDMD